jgi:AraC-like DNA-binding protein
MEHSLDHRSLASPVAPKRVARRATTKVARAIVPRGVYLALAGTGVDVVEVAAAVGLDAEEWARGDLAVTPPELVALIGEIVARTRDPAIGLQIGASAPPETLGVVGLLVATAPRFGAAVMRCGRYKRLLTDSRVELRRAGGDAIITVDVIGARDTSAQVRVDIELAFLCNLGRRMATPPVGPTRVDLRRARPADATRFERFFGCPVRFDRETDALCYPLAALEAPLASGNAEVHDLLTGLADRRLAELGDRVIGRVRAVVEGLLVEGVPHLAEVAARVGMSERSVQRALRSEDTTFTRLVESVRRDVAMRHIDDDRVSISELAYLAGFSHPSSFHRAFHRWTRSSPESYRRRGTRRR